MIVFNGSLRFVCYFHDIVGWQRMLFGVWRICVCPRRCFGFPDLRCLVVVWVLFSRCLGVWSLFGRCLGVVWSLFGCCLVVVWSLFGCLVVVWSLFGLCLGVVWMLFGRCSPERFAKKAPMYGTRNIELARAGFVNVV